MSGSRADYDTHTVEDAERHARERYVDEGLDLEEAAAGDNDAPLVSQSRRRPLPAVADYAGYTPARSETGLSRVEYERDYPF